MYRYGMTQWVVGNEALERSFRRLSACGYDAIEYACEPQGLDRALCHQLMQAHGICCLSLCGMFGEERDLTLAPEQAGAAVCYLRDSVDLAVDLGASVVIVVPSPVGRVAPPENVEVGRLWDNAVCNLSSAAGYAADRGVCLAIEPINRYETFLVNTVEQACRMAAAVDSPAVGMMADTFHMNIEERNPTAAVRAGAKYLKHVHVADSGRGPAGTGHTDFQALFYALADIGYNRAIVMEFMCRSANPYGVLKMEAQSELMDGYARVSLDTLRALERAVQLV